MVKDVLMPVGYRLVRLGWVWEDIHTVSSPPVQTGFLPGRDGSLSLFITPYRPGEQQVLPLSCRR